MAPPPRRGRPIAGRPLLLRPRLLGALQQRFDIPVVVVVAPAGFGKTTLLSQALVENELAPRGRDVWLPCRPEDTVLSVFAAGLYRAVGLPHPPGETPAEVAAEVADALWSAAPDEVAVVIDDVHHLLPESPGQAVLGELLARLPGNGHLVLAGRQTPAVAVARLVAAGDAVALDAEALAFTEHEVAEFAALRHVEPGQLQHVAGWPALAELSASAGRSAVSDYLWDELLAGMSPEQRRALAAVAAVGGADAQLGAAVTGRHDLRELLGGLPLVSATTDGWWTAHPLWQDALAGELTADEVAVARREAARVLRGRGQVHEAMSLLLLTDAWDSVRELLLEVCGCLSPAVPTDVLQQWWTRLPAEVQETPEGLLLSGLMRESSSPDEGARLLERAFAESGGTGDVALSAIQSMILIAFWRNDVTRLPELIERLGVLARGRPDAAALHTLVRGLLTMDPEVVQQRLREAPLVAESRLSPVLDWLRAQLLLLHVGDPGAAVPFARAALSRAELTLRSSVRCELVEALRLLGQVDEAAAQVPALLADIELSVVKSPRHLVAAVAAIELGGNSAEAAGVLPALRARACASPMTWAPLACALAEALHSVQLGREDEAAQGLRDVARHPQARLRFWLRISPLSLPLLFVLAPETRAGWGSLPLPGCLGRVHAAVEALVALREEQSLAPVHALDVDWQALRGQLPVPWAVELAAARVAAGPHPPAETLLRELGQTAKAPLRALAQSPISRLATCARSLLAGLPAKPAHAVRVESLGPLRLFRDGVEVVDSDVRRERVRHLLGLLLVTRTLPRARAAAELWPDLDEAAAARNLRVTLNYLQRLLEPDRDEHEAPYFLRSTGSLLRLVPDGGLTADVWEFEAALDEAEAAERQAAPSLGIDRYRRAVDLYRGAFLVDLPHAEWLEPERDRLAGRFVRAATRLGQLMLVKGRVDDAEALARRALQADEFCEQAFHLLASVEVRRGDRPRAGRYLRHCRAKLAELGVAPGPALLRLERELAGGASPGVAPRQAADAASRGRGPATRSRRPATSVRD